MAEASYRNSIMLCAECGVEHEIAGSCIQNAMAQIAALTLRIEALEEREIDCVET